MNKLQLLHLSTACAQKRMPSNGSVSNLVSSFQNTKGVLLAAVGDKCENVDVFAVPHPLKGRNITSQLNYFAWAPSLACLIYNFFPFDSSSTGLSSSTRVIPEDRSLGADSKSKDGMNQEYYIPLPSLEETCHRNLSGSPRLGLFVVALLTYSESHCSMLLCTTLKEAQLHALLCLSSVEKQGT